MNNPDFNEPFGLLILSPDGTIHAAPSFFLEALQTKIGDSIFELFAIERCPRLNFVRFESRSHNLIEYHVIVESQDCDPYSFRYWYRKDNDDDKSVFAIIDDTAVHRYEEWRFHELRSLITHDVQNVIISEFRDKLTTLSVLTEALLQADEELPEVAKKLSDVSSSLDLTINNIDRNFIEDEASAASEAPIALHDLIRTIPSWSRGDMIINVSMQAKVSLIMINDGFLSQAMQPIITNALDASEGISDKIEVYIEAPDDDPDFILVTVKDTGVGMDINTLARAEDPFFTTKEGHVGLGLSYVRQFVDSHQARLNIISSGKGTTVTLAIPIANQQ